MAHLFMGIEIADAAILSTEDGDCCIECGARRTTEGKCSEECVRPPSAEETGKRAVPNGTTPVAGQAQPEAPAPALPATAA